MRPQDLLDYDAEHLEKLTDKELEELFKELLPKTRPVKGQAVANVVNGMVKNMVKTVKSAGKGAAPDLNTMLQGMLSPEQLKELGRLEKEMKDKKK